MRKVLMITYVFPPAAWVGAHRTLKYCKYLGVHGWTPIVLTAKPIGVTFQDEKLVRQLPPEIAVHRTFDMDPAKWEDSFTAWRLRRSTPSGPSSPAPRGPAEAAPSRGVRGRAKEFIKSLLKDSPDSHLFWVPFAFCRGLWILLREKVDVIYCSTPPHSSHLIAYLLAKCTRKPYVLDFRDPWYVEGSARPPQGKIPLLLKLETSTKRRIVRGAAKVICVSQGELEELRAEFPGLSEDRFACITNGYDPSDLPASGPVAAPSPRLTLIHAGTIYSGVADEFFEALRQLVDTDPGAARAMQVHLLGDIAHGYADALRELEALNIVKFHGLQPHATTLAMVHSSDVVVILMGGTRFLPSHLPSKAFEYLHAGKPILAIAGEGELAQLVRQSGLGITVPPRSVASVVDTLRALLADHAAGRLARTPNRTYIRGFERAALAEKLARVLDGAMQDGPVRP
jgi:glycosyltransferase involved in cell wall biosynthesis